MKHIKTPFSAIDMVTRILVVDADLEPLFNVVDQVHIPDPSAVATEIVLAVNAYDAMLAALRQAEQALRNLAKGWLDGDGQTIALNEAANLRAALALAEEGQ